MRDTGDSLGSHPRGRIGSRQKLMALDDWNSRYRTGEHPADPAPLLVEAVRGQVPGRALDLACGAGRNAAYLSANGWEVVAIDGASEAIRLVRERDPLINALELDFETGAPLPFADETFDLVLILFYLHRPLFGEARRVLRRGGLLVTAIRTCGINPNYCVMPGELKKLFGDWDVVVARDDDVSELIVRKT